jgi:hypothetical protein
VLAAATLDRAQWGALLRLADDETRRFIETLHPDATAPPEAPAIEAPAPEPVAAPSASLSEVVARIERRRRSRDAHRFGGPAGQPQEAPSLFRWECGPSGEIAWVEGAPRGPLVGRSIARLQDGDSVDEDVVRAFARRAPFRDAELTVSGEGLVAGAWKISGLPAFDPTDGRFAGYRGVAERDSAPPPPRQSGPNVLADPDSLRELVHEIKTPLNAIIGFAEIIQGQYLGPADHRYRERAGDIVSEARLLLQAIDDLDFAAKIHSSAGGTRRIDLGQLIEGARNSLGEIAARRQVELEMTGRAPNRIAALEPEIADRLLARFVSAVVEGAEAGEHLRLAIEGESDCRISISRPASLRDVPDNLLFEGIGEAGGPRIVSAGFSLRLVRGLAQVAGGDLLISASRLTLVFPNA